MTTCPSCGSKIAEDAPICPYCGKMDAGYLGVEKERKERESSLSYLFELLFGPIIELFQILLWSFQILTYVMRWLFFTKYGWIFIGFAMIIGLFSPSKPSVPESNAKAAAEVELPVNRTPNKESVQTIGFVKGKGVRLRSSMDTTTKANIIDKLSKGTRVEILERSGEWLKVRVNGKEGYMFAELVNY